MPAPTFELGTILAGDPTTYLLQVGLFSGPDLDENPVEFANLVECNFPGYARVGGSAWLAPDQLEENTVRRRCLGVNFACTAPAPGQSARGWFVSAWDGARMLIIHAEEFDAPRPMDASGKKVSFDVEVNAYQGSALTV